MSTNDNQPGFDIRKSLIVDDFNTYVEASLTNRRRIDTLRQWKITLIVVVFSFGLSQGILHTLVNLIGAIVIIFALTGLVVRGRMQLTNELGLEIERLLSTSDDEYLLAHYPFRVTRWANINLKRKTLSLLRGLLFPEFIIWNLALIIFIVLLRWAITVGHLRTASQFPESIIPKN